MNRQTIHTENAPAALGTYSQAVRHGDTVYLSGQVPLDPATMQLEPGDITTQIRRVFSNLQAVCEAAGGELDGIVKLNVYLIDMGNFAAVNQVMAEYFSEPYPARAAVGVSALPAGAQVEVEAVLGL